MVILSHKFTYVIKVEKQKQRPLPFRYEFSEDTDYRFLTSERDKNRCIREKNVRSLLKGNPTQEEIEQAAEYLQELDNEGSFITRLFRFLGAK